MLCLRALVPAGFMLVPIDGRISYVLCDAQSAAALHHHGDHHQHPGHSHNDPTCPYAQSGGPAPLPALPVLPQELLAGNSLAPPRSSQVYSPFGPTRQQPARAPPLYA